MNNKKSARKMIATAVAKMRENNESTCVVDIGDLASNTIQNYLWGHQHPGEKFDYTKNEDGSLVIELSHKKTEGLEKPELVSKMVGLKHLQCIAIPFEDLAISVQYAKNVISGLSGDGVRCPKYLKQDVNGKLYVFCINEKEVNDQPQPASPPYLQQVSRAARPKPNPKPESPARWLQRQICYLFLDELEKQLIFKADTTKQRSVFKKLAKTAEINPAKFGGLNFSATYDYGKDSLVIRRKSRRKGLWHRGDLVARAAQRPEKGYSRRAATALGDAVRYPAAPGRYGACAGFVVPHAGYR